MKGDQVKRSRMLSDGKRNKDFGCCSPGSRSCHYDKRFECFDGELDTTEEKRQNCPLHL